MYKFIIYSRRSKERKSGNQYTHETAEWQVKQYLTYLDSQGVKYEIVDHIAEDISGYGYYTKRPLFTEIVKRCKADKSLTLLSSKHDRIARDGWTGSELLKTINMVIASHPDADDFTHQILFSTAEKEVKNTSERWLHTVKAKRERCKQTGEKFIWGGNSPKWQESYHSNKMNHVSKSKHTEAMQSWEEKRAAIQGVINMMKKSKIKLTYKNIADNLQTFGVKNAMGGCQWSSGQAHKALDYLNISR